MARRSDLQEVVQQFVDRVSSIIEQEVVSRAREQAVKKSGQPARPSRPRRRPGDRPGDGGGNPPPAPLAISGLALLALLLEFLRASGVAILLDCRLG